MTKSIEIEIAENYPDNIEVDTYLESDGIKFGFMIWKLNEGIVCALLLESEDGIYDSVEEAVTAGHKVCKQCKDLTYEHED